MVFCCRISEVHGHELGDGELVVGVTADAQEGWSPGGGAGKRQFQTAVTQAPHY